MKYYCLHNELHTDEIDALCSECQALIVWAEKNKESIRQRRIRRLTASFDWPDDLPKDYKL